MEPLTLAAITTLSPIISSAIGNILSSGGREAQQAAMQKFYDLMANSKVPPDTAAQILKAKFQAVGAYTPQLEKDIDVEANAYANVKQNPEYQNAIGDTLNRLKQQSASGFTPEERYNQSMLANKVARDQQSARAQIQQAAQQKGISGGGQQLASELQAVSTGSAQQAEGADRYASEASKKALDALMGRYNVASQQSQNDFNQQARVADSQNASNQFLASLKATTQARNVGAQNTAGMADYQNRQNVANANSQIPILAAQSQAKDYDSYLKWLSLQGDAAKGQGDQYGQSASNTNKQWTDIGTAVGQGALVYNNASNKQDKPNLAENPSIITTPTPSIGTDDGKNMPVWAINEKKKREDAERAASAGAPAFDYPNLLTY